MISKILLIIILLILLLLMFYYISRNDNVKEDISNIIFDLNNSFCVALTKLKIINTIQLQIEYFFLHLLC